jgi:hypothetical protein
MCRTVSSVRRSAKHRALPFCAAPHTGAKRAVFGTATVCVELLAAAGGPAVAGAPEGRNPALAAAGPAIPSTTRDAAALTAAIRRRSLGTFQMVSMKSFN